MPKNFNNVKIRVMEQYCRNPAFEFPRKNKLGKKRNKENKLTKSFDIQAQLQSPFSYWSLHHSKQKF